ncbi:dipeptidyl aminopeptidase/acylaminoacyl peptidase [Sphingobium fontiphilum]|uniref:Dipeptidyl aminopeptidase/acylaminoacyl peptidase n=1 Tax=Sphingobium fontiphilum TaxID=944425 RepID=A0A7W6DBT2_9SPHN|nr:S9 family peptidase [Sphingobium fontiphilum]MBB3980376.1 dipeptidyl aminopeptidase/acylaminoacyl peptidase [Sphingobium fontiphilum]
MKYLPAAALAAIMLAPLPALARPFTPADMVNLNRLSAPVVSAEGRWLAYQLRTTDFDNNRGRNDLYLLDLQAKGATPRLIASVTDKNETAPTFAPDGASLYYLSDASGDDQLWRVALSGGEPVKITDAPGGLSGYLLSPMGDKVALWADRPIGAATLADTAPAKAKDAGSGRVYDRLFVRHWDSWSDGQRSQIFVMPLKPGAKAVSVMGGLIGDAPSKPFGGAEELAWSRDGKTLFFALREAGRIEPLSTNLDIFATPIDGGGAPVNLTDANDATDTMPTVSPDGQWLAYAAMARPGYESDRLVLMLRNIASGETRALTQDWDRSVASIAWEASGKSLIVTADEVLDHPAFRVDVASGRVTRLTGAGHVGGVTPLPDGGFLYALDSIQSPADLWRMGKGGKPVRLTSVNADKLAGVDDVSVERFSFRGANGDTVWGQIIKPLNPSATGAGAKLPVAYLVHGGPQGSFGDSWSYRWNPKAFAAAGYAAVTVDFHGSTGYGQAFVDSINKDWGGKPLEDLKLGLAAAAAKDAQVDASNACALGASYGGYMMNWIEGRWPDAFKCIVQHDGVFDARAMAYETEELWFDEWEHGGPYYEQAAEYEKWNPVAHVTAWKTPMLVITSEKDFRIPYTQGLAAFTALQRRDIASKLLIFPDENHWVLKPKNSLQWYGEVLGWLGQWTGK